MSALCCAHAIHTLYTQMLRQIVRAAPTRRVGLVCASRVLLLQAPRHARFASSGPHDLSHSQSMFAKTGTPKSMKKMTNIYYHYFISFEQFSNCFLHTHTYSNTSILHILPTPKYEKDSHLQTRNLCEIYSPTHFPPTHFTHSSPTLLCEAV